jgi:hypothetical protein
MVFRCFIFLISTLFLFACNSSSDDTQASIEILNNELCEINNASLHCDGGYSYWINDITATSGSVLAITGVRNYNNSSQQWVSFFTNDLTEKLAEVAFPLDFYVDEHNAPAVLPTDDGHWLVVRTGHNDTFEQGKGKLFTYLLDNTFSIIHEAKLTLDNGATYAQLAEINGTVYLLTRDTETGWGIFTSQDSGENWGRWEKLWRGGGKRYISMQSFNGDTSGNKQLIFNLGNHPSDTTQKIAYLIAKQDDNGGQLITHSGLPLDDDNINDELITSYYEKSTNASHIRLLDSANTSHNVCHLYSKLNTQTNDWELYLSGHNLLKNRIENYYIGEFSGVLGDSTYVNGASIGGCLLDSSEQFDVFVVDYDPVTKYYHIHRVFVDMQSGDTRIEEVAKSLNQLYRPIYIPKLNYLMYNEALTWENYQRWRASQRLIKL